MAISSTELLNRCVASGLLSKEAAEDVQRARVKLIKEALAIKAAGWTGDVLRRVGSGGVRAGDAVLGKNSNWSDAAANIGRMMVLGGAVAGVAGAASGIARHSRDKGVRREIESSYKQMFNETPGLDQMDKTKVGRHFGVLARYAPSIAADPTVAGAWVKNTIQMGHIDAELVSRLSATQSIIDRRTEDQSLFRPGSFTAGMGIAQSALGKANEDANRLEMATERRQEAAQRRADAAARVGGPGRT